MPSLYHFNSDQFKENLFLGGQQHMVAGRLCQYLKGWQLDGIRFLYKHFEKGESCILNDESGLGKVVATSVFLGAVLSNDTTKKCLIIVRDDDYIEGWRFHLSVLTQLSVKVIQRTSDITQETVFLIKWSTIKDIGQITKTTFDHIIVDNRGEMLANKFCTGILLRHYETKISIVISSSDVTADINLLHILLRLCGRIDKQYADVKAFEAKFQLPTLKDGVCNKIDLEDYFLKREKVINFCREFRLRRYRHQFEEQFPLVPSNDFKRYLQQWRTSANSQSSGSAKLCSSSSEKDVEELFQAYFRVKQERDDRKTNEQVDKIIESIVCEDTNSNCSDELLVMSPLLVLSESESDNEQNQTREEPLAVLSDEIKDEEEKKDEQTESTSAKETTSSKIDRRKLTKPVKNTTVELVSPKSLRSREVASASKRAVKTKPNDVLEKIVKKRGRPPGKKLVQLNDNAVKHPRNEVLGSKETPKLEKASKEKTGNKIESTLDKAIAKKKDTAADCNTHKTKGSKDDDKKKKKKSLNPENTSKHSDDISKELLKHKVGVEKTAKRGTIAGEGKKSDVVPKENSKTNEKTILKKSFSTKDNKTVDVDKNKGATALKRSRSKLDEKSDAFEGVVKVKKKKLTETVTITKQHKEEENQNRRAKDDRVKAQNKLVQESKKGARIYKLDLMIAEAKQFLQTKSTSDARGNEENGYSRTRRTSEKSPVHNKSASISGGRVSKPQTSNSSKKPRDSNISPNQLKQEKDRSDTPRRCKPLTVYTVVGAHSRSTRGMQRCTRSSAVHSKYMGVSEAQVGLDKLAKPKRHFTRRQSMVAERSKPSNNDVKPETNVLPESCATLESMQLGQALTPTNPCSATEFLAPIPKKVGYEFLLLLDKDIPDSECIITSQSSNKNEVIILTESSNSSSESAMEPLKGAVNYRLSSMKPPPMVTIPRQSHNKAKSPDLFSTCSDLSLPCSQQKSSKSTFDGFKIFGSEVRQHLTTLSDGANRITQQPANRLPLKKASALSKEVQSSSPNHSIDDEDAMFEITANGTFSNMIRVNSNGDMSPLRNKQSTPPSVSSHQKNRITNYLIGSNQQANGTSPSPSLDDQIDNLQKTPKRRKSLSGTMKRSPRGLYGPKPQSTKLTQWLIKNSPVVRISEKPMKASSTKRKRLDLLFPDDK